MKYLEFTKEQAEQLLTALKGKEVAAILKGFKEVFLQELEDSPEKFGNFEIVISTEAIDRAGDSIKIAGWETDRYMKNPVVLWAHDYSMLPVGITTELSINEKKQLVARGYFAPQEANPFAQNVRKLYELGFVAASSVGFIPKEFEGNENAEGFDIFKAELLEWSFVPVPCNYEALDQRKEMIDELVEKGLLDLEDNKVRIKTLNIESAELMVKAFESIKKDEEEEQEKPSDEESKEEKTKASQESVNKVKAFIGSTLAQLTTDISNSIAAANDAIVTELDALTETPTEEGKSFKVDQHKLKFITDQLQTISKTLSGFDKEFSKLFVAEEKPDEKAEDEISSSDDEKFFSKTDKETNEFLHKVVKTISTVANASLAKYNKDFAKDN